MLKGLIMAQEKQAEILKRCAQRIDQGALKIQLSHRFALAQAEQAHRLLEQGSITDKIALEI